MGDETHVGSQREPGDPGRWRRLWRRPDSGWKLATPLVLGVAVMILATSWRLSDGTDLRPQSYDGLSGLVNSDSAEVQDKNAQVASLTQDVQDLTSAVADREVQRLQRQQEKRRGPAGLTAKTGPAVTVTLSDAPYDVDNPPNVDDINKLVVHQQDIQAVVNAMWAGGADAVTVQGQRIVSTTGIKCEGNSVQLQGVPYPQPYEITAVGSQERILAALENNSYLAGYRTMAADPSVGIGWSLETRSRYTAPAFDGLLDITHAQVQR